MHLLRSRALAALAVVGAITLVGCGASDDASGGRPGSIEVIAGFYPLQWIAEGVGGDHVSVDNLTPPGAEPHELELSPRDVAEIADADLVFYQSALAPTVDDAVKSSGARAFDAAPSANLDLVLSSDGEEHADGDRSATTDPHFWLDPVRMGSVTHAFAEELATVDPDHAADYRANAKRVTAELHRLDQEFEDGLASCDNRNLVTTHAAFGYLAQRYHLKQKGIVGLSTQQEPSPADLADVTRFVEHNDVKTIYFETLVSPDIAKTIASETGAKTDVLDPLEGLTDTSQGDDYLAVMRSNLANLKAGQPCP